MSEKSQIILAACISDAEQPAVRSAANQLTRSLRQASSVPWECDPVFASSVDALAKFGGDRIILTSFLPELTALELLWPQHEARLRGAYAALCQGGSVFICTIFRHVRQDEPQAQARLIRIRRLNLLAAEISREFGAHVIDLDRALAHIGSQRLQTDYQLRGKKAAEVAGHFIATTLIDTAMDSFCSFDVQDAAKSILKAGRPVLEPAGHSKPETTLSKNLMTIGQGRKRQVVSPVGFATRENRAGWLLRQILRGAISPRELWRQLRKAIRNQGVRHATAVIAAGVVRQVRNRK